MTNLINFTSSKPQTNVDFANEFFIISLNKYIHSIDNLRQHILRPTEPHATVAQSIVCADLTSVGRMAENLATGGAEKCGRYLLEWATLD